MRTSDDDLNDFYEEVKRDPFSEYQRKRTADDDDFKNDPMFRGFRPIRDQDDPLRAQETPPPRAPLTDFAQQVRNKTNEIRQNWNEAQFLSDYGRPDRPSAEVKVNPLFLIIFFAEQMNSE